MSTQSEVLTRYETVIGDPDETRMQDILLQQGGFVHLGPKRWKSENTAYESATATLTRTALLIESNRRIQRKVFLHIPLESIVRVETAKSPSQLLGPPSCVKIIWRERPGRSGDKYWFLFEPYQGCVWSSFRFPFVSDLLRSEEPSLELKEAIRQTIPRLWAGG